MAQGVPCLASPQPSYQELIKGQSGGYICNTLNDWDMTIAKIREDRRILAQWLNEAHQGMQNYSTLSIAKRYAQLFVECISLANFFNYDELVKIT